MEILKLKDEPIEADLVTDTLDQLEKLEFNEGFSLAHIPMDQRKLFTQRIRVKARARGFAVTLKYIKEEMTFRGYKVNISPRLNEKTKEIIARRLSGETLASIGKSFGMSRQAIEQKLKYVGSFSALPVGSIRTEKLMEFMSSYIDATPDKMLCYLCQEEITHAHKRRGGMCLNCSAIIKAQTRASSHIRTFKKSGFTNLHVLSEALVLIRRYALKPEDLKNG